MDQELQRVPVHTVDIAMITAAVKDPTFDAAKLHALLDFQERVDAKAREASFNESLARMQPLLPTITKNGMIRIPPKDGKAGQETAYAKYEDIDRMIRPLMMMEGFSFSFTSAPPSTDGRYLITGTLRHRDGFCISSSIPLALETSGSKNNVQGMGSTISYGKRYLVCMLLNLVAEGEDNDGNPVVINEQQRENLTTLMDAANFTPDQKRKVLKWLNAESVEQVLAKNYDRGVAWLKKQAQ